MDIISSS